MRIGIDTRKVQVSRSFRALMEQQVTRRLQRFATAIREAKVELSDRNGRRGGGDKRCRIQVLLEGGAKVKADEMQASVRKAFVHAVSRVQAALLKHSRFRPLPVELKA